MIEKEYSEKINTVLSSISELQNIIKNRFFYQGVATYAYFGFLASSIILVVANWNLSSKAEKLIATSTMFILTILVAFYLTREAYYIKQKILSPIQVARRNFVWRGIANSLILLSIFTYLLLGDDNPTLIEVFKYVLIIPCILVSIIIVYVLFRSSQVGMIYYVNKYFIQMGLIPSKSRYLIEDRSSLPIIPLLLLFSIISTTLLFAIIGYTLTNKYDSINLNQLLFNPVLVGTGLTGILVSIFAIFTNIGYRIHNRYLDNLKVDALSSNSVDKLRELNLLAIESVKGLSLNRLGIIGLSFVKEALTESREQLLQDISKGEMKKEKTNKLITDYNERVKNWISIELENLISFDMRIEDDKLDVEKIKEIYNNSIQSLLLNEQSFSTND